MVIERILQKGLYSSGSSKPAHDKTVSDKEGLVWCVVFLKVFQCCVTSISLGWKRIVISIVRSSQTCPTFGRKGMLQCATTAGNAYIQLDPQRPALPVVDSKDRTSSSAELLCAAVDEILHNGLMKPAIRDNDEWKEPVCNILESFKTPIYIYPTAYEQRHCLGQASGFQAIRGEPLSDKQGTSRVPRRSSAVHFQD